MTAAPRKLETKVGLWYLFLNFLVPGAWALLWPSGFYHSFPLPGHPWVAADGPFNEHLLRDFGGLNLALASLALTCLRAPRQISTRTVAVAVLFFAVPHLLYHLTHLQALDRMADQLWEVTLLGLQVLVPALMLAHPEQA